MPPNTISAPAATAGVNLSPRTAIAASTLATGSIFEITALRISPMTRTAMKNPRKPNRNAAVTPAAPTQPSAVAGGTKPPAAIPAATKPSAAIADI